MILRTEGLRYDGFALSPSNEPSCTNAYYQENPSPQYCFHCRSTTGKTTILPRKRTTNNNMAENNKKEAGRQKKQTNFRMNAEDAGCRAERRARDTPLFCAYLSYRILTPLAVWAPRGLNGIIPSSPAHVLSITTRQVQHSSLPHVLKPMYTFHGIIRTPQALALSIKIQKIQRHVSLTRF